MAIWDGALALKTSLRLPEGMPDRLLSVDPARLKALRARTGMEIGELAERVGATTRMVAYWEAGTHTPEAQSLRQLARVLGCTVATLTGCSPGTETLADLRYAAGMSTEKAAVALREDPIGQLLFVSATKLRNLERGRYVRGWAWRNPAHTGRFVRRMAKLYGVPPRMVLDAWLRTRPGDPAPAMGEPHPPATSPAAQSRWDALNARQQVYLAEIMRDDRLVEAEMWLRRAHHLRVPPAAQWRKLPFALRAPADLVGYTRLQERLRARGVHDPGAGPTLHALERASLVVVSEDEIDFPGVGNVPRVLVELSRTGRAAARTGLHEPRQPGQPEHLLSEWLWRSMLRIIDAGPAGLGENDLTGKAPFYLAVGYRPTRGAHASRGFIISAPVMAADGSHVREYRWQLTQLGTRHILEYSQQYAEIYPNPGIGPRGDIVSDMG